MCDPCEPAARLEVVRDVVLQLLVEVCEVARPRELSLGLRLLLGIGALRLGVRLRSAVEALSILRSELPVLELARSALAAASAVLKELAEAADMQTRSSKKLIVGINTYNKKIY